MTEIINKGDAPSIARNFGLYVKINGIKYYGFPQLIGNNFSLKMPDGHIATLYGNDALYKKASKPIPPGGEVEGVLVFYFNNLDMGSVRSGDATFVFLYEDAYGNDYKTPIKLSPEPNDKLIYFPQINITISQ